MAVQDKYTDSNISGNIVSKLLQAINGSGTEEKVIYATFEVAAADDDTSKFRVFKALDANIIPTQILVANDALTSGTDWDVGLYYGDLGAAIGASVTNCFADALDLSSAHASIIPGTALNGMKDVAIENYGRRLFEHAGHTISTKRGSYDLVLTANTIGSAAGTVSVMMRFARG